MLGVFAHMLAISWGAEMGCVALESGRLEVLRLHAEDGVACKCCTPAT